MDKPLSQLNAVFKLATEKTLSGSDLLVYLHLFNKFNQAHWTETILVRDVELLKLVNLYDSNGKPAALATIRNAKARLKKKGFINFKITPAGTEYRLIQLYPMDPPIDTPADPPMDPPADPLTRSNIRVREDVKDVKTLDVNYYPASARANVNKLDELINYWSEEIGGGRLTFEHQSKLAVFLERYGVEWVKAAMDEAADVNHDQHGVKPKLLFAILENKAKPKQQLRLLKGGEKVGQSDSGSEYKKPVYTGNEVWANF